DIESAVAPWPGKHRLDVETLALPILIIGGDPLCGLRLDVFDTQHVADRMDAAHGRLAYVATFRFVALVRGATLVADIERVGCEPAAVFRTDVGRQLGLGNAVGAALVVNQAARPKLRNGDETSALEISGFG